MTALQAAPNPDAVHDPDRWVWVPRVLHAVALVGIPASVVWATGGFDAIGFWVEAIFHFIVAFTLGAALFTLAGYLMTAPLARLRRRFRPAINDDAASYGIVGLFVLGGTVYFLTEPAINDYRVNLPTDSANLGAFVILLSAGVAGWTMFRLASTVRRTIGTRRSPELLSSTAVFTRPMRPWGATPAEPIEEYWSPSAITAWRSWAWNGQALHGYRIAWTEAMLVAGCDECSRSPGWEHACGIYATKEREDVELFGQVPVLGRIEMWGDVVEHEYGYRSSHARITDLWVDSPVHARRMGRAYPGVRVWEGMPRATEEVRIGEYR